MTYRKKLIEVALPLEAINIEQSGMSAWLLTQQLTRTLESGKGIQEATQIIHGLYKSGGEEAKSLAYRLFTIADDKGWAQGAFAYNSLVISWPEIQVAVSELKAQAANQEQMTINE